MSTIEKRYWWTRDDLHFADGHLSLSGVRLGEMVDASKRPTFVYSASRIAHNLQRLFEALRGAGLDSRIFYAMKANRFAPLLKWIRAQNLCGVDVCSPGELALAEACGFDDTMISYTGTSVSNRDLDLVSAHPRILFNCDSLSAIRRLGERTPGRAIGIRVNPGIGIGYRQNDRLQYAGEKATKLGVYREQFDDALALAGQYRLDVEGIHFHCGCGFLDPELPLYAQILERVEWFISKVPSLRYVNVGGGLGIPLAAGDAPLDLSRWGRLLEQRFGGRDIVVMVEPGDYVVKDAGVLVLEVNTVEEKAGTLFIGVNGGFNLHPEPTFYRLPLEAVPCRFREEEHLRVTIAGNINEAHDLFGENLRLPKIGEGELLSLLNAGGYGSAMLSNHCARGEVVERLI